MKNKWDKRSFVFIIVVAIEPIPRFISVARRGIDSFEIRTIKRVLLQNLNKFLFPPKSQLPTVSLGSREKHLEFIEPSFPPTHSSFLPTPLFRPPAPFLMGLSLRWTIGEPNPPPLPLSFYPPHLLSRFFWSRCDRRKGGEGLLGDHRCPQDEGDGGERVVSKEEEEGEVGRRTVAQKLAQA